MPPHRGDLAPTCSPSTRATTVGAITSLALAAVDTALWDLRVPARRPAAVAARRRRRDVPLYDTEGGWLHLTADELVAGAQALAGGRAGRGVKLKVGKPTRPRTASGWRGPRRPRPGFDLMVDANQSMTAAEAIRRARLLEPVDLDWFEEPLPADDVAGHDRLARRHHHPDRGRGVDVLHRASSPSTCTAGAAGIVQVDVARIGGITPWLKVAHLAEAFNVVVCPHFLMELHVSLVRRRAEQPLRRAHPAAARDHHGPRSTIVDGHALAPERAGPRHRLGPRRDRGPEGGVKTETAPEAPAVPPAAEPGRRPRALPVWANPRLGLLIVIAALVVLFSSLTPAFLDPRLTLAPLQADISVYVVVGLAQLAVLSLGHMNMAVGRMAALSTFAMGLAYDRLGVPLLVGLLVGLAVGAGIGALAGLLIAKTGVNSFVVTLALDFGLLGLVTILYTWATGGVSFAVQPSGLSALRFDTFADYCMGDVCGPGSRWSCRSRSRRRSASGCCSGTPGWAGRS